MTEAPHRDVRQPDAGQPVATRGHEWQRLDRRMLLVHPIRELIRFLPVLIGLLLAGTAAGRDEWSWQLLGVGVPDRARACCAT